MSIIFTLLGLPNSGKSSIVNCITNKNNGIISEISGTTVDFVRYPIEQLEDCFITDTAGYHKTFFEENEEKIKKSNYFLFVIDGIAPIQNEHIIFIRNLRKIFPEKMQDCLLIINKLDKSKKNPINYQDIAKLGFKNSLEISAIQRTNISQLLDYIKSKKDVKKFSKNINLDDEPVKKITQYKVGIFGKSNVGKSTLMNLLSKEDVSVVRDSMNTTVDVVENVINLKDKVLLIQDTAGFSKEQKIKYEGYPLKKTQETLQNCDIAIIMTDFERGITNTDLSLFGLCKKYNKAFIVVINKWDQAKHSANPQYLNGQFERHELLNINCISCLNSYGIRDLKKNIIDIVGFFSSKLDTKKLNKWCQNILNYNHEALRVKYITQINSTPPTFAVNINFKNQNFLSVLQQSIRKNFYNGANIPIVIKLIR